MPALEASGALFARKFDERTHGDVLDWLDEVLLRSADNLAVDQTASGATRLRR